MAGLRRARILSAVVNAGMGLPPTAAGLFVAYLVSRHGFLHLDRACTIEAMVGARGARLAALLLRETKTGVLAACMAAYGGIVSEVGAAMMTGCSLAGTGGDTRLLTTSAVEEVRKGNYSRAAWLTVLLLAIVAVIGAVLSASQRRAVR